MPPLGERLNCSPEAARALAKGLRLPRQRANDGKALVAVDVAELAHKPMPARSPAGDRADFERERADRLMAELLRATADTMAAKEAAARLDGELAALRSRPWWRWMVG
jgi:hypothetical protein